MKILIQGWFRCLHLNVHKCSLLVLESVVASLMNFVSVLAVLSVVSELLLDCQASLC